GFAGDVLPHRPVDDTEEALGVRLGVVPLGRVPRTGLGPARAVAGRLAALALRLLVLRVGRVVLRLQVRLIAQGLVHSPRDARRADERQLVAIPLVQLDLFALE